MRTFRLIIIFCWLFVTFNFPKTLMVLLLCMAFVGQTVASTIMSYHMTSMMGMNGQDHSQDMQMMNHSSHNMASDSLDNSYSSEEPSEDCCVKTCNCFTGGCSSVATLMKDVSNTPVFDLSLIIFSYSHPAQTQQPKSLYRPPILS